MSGLPLLSSNDIIRKLRKAGFINAPHQGKGSHIALSRLGDDGKRHLVIIPKRDPVPKGTLISILKQAHLTKEEFLELG